MGNAGRHEDRCPGRRFDFAVVKGTAGEPDRLIYAGLDRFQYSDVQLLKWSAGGRTDWFDGSTSPQASSGLMAQTSGLPRRGDREAAPRPPRYHPP